MNFPATTAFVWSCTASIKKTFNLRDLEDKRKTSWHTLKPFPEDKKSRVFSIYQKTVDDVWAIYETGLIFQCKPLRQNRLLKQKAFTRPTDYVCFVSITDPFLSQHSAQGCSTEHYVTHQTDDRLIATPAVRAERRVVPRRAKASVRPTASRGASGTVIYEPPVRSRQLSTRRVTPSATEPVPPSSTTRRPGFDHRTRVGSLRTPVRKWGYPILLLPLQLRAVSNDAPAADVKTTNSGTPY